MSAISNSILDPEYHDRLLKDIKHVARVANIHEGMLHKSATQYCPPNVCRWVANLRAHQHNMVGGLCLVGKFPYDPSTMVMAIAAAIVRNYVDARVHSMTDMLTFYEKHDVPDPTVLLIPNLFVALHGKALTSWQIQALMDILTRRFTAGKMTVVHVENLDLLESQYGTFFAQHIREHYSIIEGSGA